jgi:hypothetical protein
MQGSSVPVASAHQQNTQNPVGRASRPPCRARTAHFYHAQARRLCHQILNNFSNQNYYKQLLTDLWPAYR